MGPVIHKRIGVVLFWKGLILNSTLCQLDQFWFSLLEQKKFNQLIIIHSKQLFYPARLDIDSSIRARPVLSPDWMLVNPFAVTIFLGSLIASAFLFFSRLLLEIAVWILNKVYSHSTTFWNLVHTCHIENKVYKWNVNV